MAEKTLGQVAYEAAFGYDDWEDGTPKNNAAWQRGADAVVAAHEARQWREGAIEAYERAADMLSVFPGGADAEEMMRDAAKRLREGK